MENNKNKSLFDILVDKKRNNEIFSFDDITKEELYQLYIVEEISASTISDIFNIKMHKVRTKIASWSMTLNEVIARKRDQKALHIYTKLQDEKFDISLTETELIIARQINALDENEKRNLFEYLADNHDYLKRMKSQSSAYLAYTRVAIEGI